MSHKTVAGWVAIFRLPPFGAPRIRAVKKEQKHCHFDWSVVPGDAARFENLVWGDQQIDKGLRHLTTRFPECAAWQIHMNGTKDFQSPEGIRVRLPWRFS